MSTTNRDDNPTSAEIADLHKMEMIVQHGLDAFVAASNAVSAIREAWHSRATPEPAGAAATANGGRCDDERATLTRVWEEAMRELWRVFLSAAEIRIIISDGARQTDRTPTPGPDTLSTGASAGEVLTLMRSLMSEATATAADVTHLLETRGDALDEGARAQLREDALLLDEEVETLKVLLLAPADWDAEYERLLAGDLPPFEHDPDDEDD